MFNVLKCSIIPDDFLFFVSKEFNTKTTMANFIHNYSIMYALRDRFNIVSKTYEPNYPNDLYELDYYCNPAYPSYPPSFIFQTYNSIDQRRNSPEEPKDKIKNVPSFGRYQKIIPNSTEFTFFALIKSNSKYIFPRVIRLGKKLAPCRINYKKLEVDKVDLSPSNYINFETPINLLDFSPNHDIKQSSIYYMFPSPIVYDTIAKIPYIKAKDGRKTINLPIPKFLVPEELKKSIEG